MSVDHMSANRPHLGFWCQTGDPLIVDAAAASQPDWICIDTQHGIDLGRLDGSLFTVIASYGVQSLVRVPGIDAASIGRALDLGADGVVIPLVETADDAESAVAATRHAPRGTRSFGMQTMRKGPFDGKPFVVVQIETSAAIDNLTDIALVDGVDAFYVGPSDLGLALKGEPMPGVVGFDDDIMGPALERVVMISEGAEVIPGFHCGSGEQAKVALEKGFRMMAVAADVSLVSGGLATQLADVTR